MQAELTQISTGAMCQGRLPTMQAMAWVPTVTFKKRGCSKTWCHLVFEPFGLFHFRTTKPPNPRKSGNSGPWVLVKLREATSGTLKGILFKKISYPPSAQLVVNRGHTCANIRRLCVIIRRFDTAGWPFCYFTSGGIYRNV